MSSIVWEYRYWPIVTWSKYVKTWLEHTVLFLRSIAGRKRVGKRENHLGHKSEPKSTSVRQFWYLQRCKCAYNDTLVLGDWGPFIQNHEVLDSAAVAANVCSELNLRSISVEDPRPQPSRHWQGRICGKFNDTFGGLPGKDGPINF